jgi:hypothetical protein
MLDPSGRAAGRGAYLCASADCWSAAGKRRALEHALKATLPDDIAAWLTAGPEALGATTDTTPIGAPSHPDASAPTQPTDTLEGGTHGQE